MVLNIKYSSEKDAKTYIDYVYKFKAHTHGRKKPSKQLLERLEPELQKILTSTPEEKETYKKVLEYLNKKDPKIIKDSINKLINRWESTGENTITFLEFLYQKPFPFKKVTLYMTTNHICPYSYENRYFFANYRFVSEQMDVITHELNHFMFYYYYYKLKEKLGDEKFELLKESVTFFSNPGQRGKPNEIPLRKLYKSKIFQNLESVIKAGNKFLLKN